MGLKRRAFLIGTAAAAGGLVVGWRWLSARRPNPLLEGLAKGEHALNAHVKIGRDGAITIVVPYAEMGQGVATTLAALVAEEMEVPLSAVTVAHGPASGAYANTVVLEDSSPFLMDGSSVTGRLWGAVATAAGPALGLQVTGSSTSTRDAFDKMRLAGAVARILLAESASIELGVPRDSLVMVDRRLVHQASGRSLSIGDAVSRAAALPVPDDVRLKDRSAWMVLGKPQQRTDAAAKVTGAAVFGIDVDLPDMLHGTVLLPPRFDARPGRADQTAARAVPGVTDIFTVETPSGAGWCVLAENTWAAFNGAAAIDTDWLSEGTGIDDGGVAAALDSAVLKGGGWALRDEGGAADALESADKRLVMTLDYAVPYLAHATMEPMNATARFADGVLDVWAPTQSPSLIQFTCANALDIPYASVRVHPTLLGGGFGRRVEPDFALYAALAAKHANGRAVQITWTRETDMTHDAYRPACRARIRALPGEDGVPAALEIVAAASSPTRGIASRVLPAAPVAGPDKYLAEGLFDAPYALPRCRMETVDVALPVPVGYWRSVGYSHNTFFLECALDEVAARSSADPLHQRLALLEGRTAARGVLVRAAEMAGWPERREGIGRGLAYCHAYGSHAACIAEVSGSAEALKVERLIVVADVGVALDPALVADQLVSGAVFGLGAARQLSVSLEAGGVVETNFDAFEPLRMSQCPPIETDVLQTGSHPGGVGELSTPLIAPVLANAIFDLTGRRIRTLPLNREISFS